MTASTLAAYRAALSVEKDMKNLYRQAQEFLGVAMKLHADALAASEGLIVGAKITVGGEFPALVESWFLAPASWLAEYADDDDPFLGLNYRRPDQAADRPPHSLVDGDWVLGWPDDEEDS